MPRSRSTISRDSVFRTTSGDATQSAPRQGVSDTKKPNHQTAVWLGDEEFEWLDDQCQAVRRAGWRSITRSALIRALIQAAMERELELAGVSGEVELRDRLKTRS